MKSNDKLKEIDNQNHACYYFNDIIKIKGFDPDNILTDKRVIINSHYHQSLSLIITAVSAKMLEILREIWLHGIACNFP